MPLKSSAASPARQLASFIAKYSPSMAKEGRAALARMRKLVPGATELVYDNWNGLVVGFGPSARPSEAIVSILMASDHVSLCFIQNGPSLPDPRKLLKGSGNVVRHIRLASARDLEAPAVCALVKTAVARSDVPFAKGKRRVLIIKSISPKQRPRRPV
jgi:hypothetical protein